MGGETQSELSLTASSLWDGGGVGLMVCPVQEEDVGEGAKQGYDEWVFEKNNIASHATSSSRNNRSAQQSCCRFFSIDKNCGSSSSNRSST